MFDRPHLINEFCKLCEEDGLEPNKEKIQKTFDRYSVEEIERVVDACDRFGVKAILASV